MDQPKGSQFNKRHPDKRTSTTGGMSRSRLRARISLSKSIGKIKKSGDESPIAAIQKIHLFKKQKTFLAKQAVVFEKRAEAIKQQIGELEKKIKHQRDYAAELVNDLSKDDYGEPDPKVSQHRSKPDKTMSQKKKWFKLEY
jgi:chromosome segregation ATPase